MSVRYDAIVIGGGLNGLTAAAYLAKAGRKVLVLEAREQLGGSAITGEFAPGFSADLVRHDIGTLPMAICRDLELTGQGLKLLSSMPEVLALSPGGDGLLLDPKHPRDVPASLTRLSPTDAKVWPEFTRGIAALASFLERAYEGPVPHVDASAPGDLFAGLKLGLKLRGLGKRDMIEVLRVLPMSVAELVEDSLEHPLVRALVASRGVMHTALGPRSAGTAFVMLHHQVGRYAGAFRTSIRPERGVGTLAQMLASCAKAAGAEIRIDERVTRISMKGGTASGVVLASGDEITATHIVSGASPRHTFLDLCDPAQLEPELVRPVRNIRYRGVTAKVHLALGALPAWRGAPSSERPARSIVIAPSLDYLERGYDDVKYGRVSSKPWLDLFIPTITDPSMAPEGKHVLSVNVQYAPYKLRDSGEGAGASGIREWNGASRDALADHVIKTLAEYAPELPGLILHRHVLTPKDLEEQYGLPEGNPYHGEIALDQALFMRPVPECSAYATPVRGLWLCGSGCHPGGAIPGQAGANAARAILRGR